MMMEKRQVQSKVKEEAGLKRAVERGTREKERQS